MINKILNKYVFEISNKEINKKKDKKKDKKYFQFEYNNSNFSFPGIFSFIIYEDIFSDKLKKEEIDFFINEFRDNGYSDEKINKKIIDRLNYTKTFDVTLNDMAFIGLNLYKNNEPEDEKNEPEDENIKNIVKNIVNNMLNDK